MSLIDALSRGPRPYWVIALVLMVCALPGLVALPPLDRDESRFVQATTQMFETGDFVRISFQDEPRNKKPVGIHWLQSVAVAASGGPEARQIHGFRLVSLLGALTCALAVFRIGALLLGRREGLLAACALSSSLLLSTEAGIAKTDAWLAGSVALAMWGLARARSAQAGAAKDRWAGWLFWIGLALAALIKGPVGPMLAGLAIGLLLVWERKAGWLKALVNWPAIAAAAALALPWHVAIWIATDGRFFMDAIGQDLAPKLAGAAENPSVPPGAHLLLSPVILWPASILLPAALWSGWRLRRDASGRFLLAWLAGWLIFEAAPAKLAHYTLPVHGALMLLGAAGIAQGAWRIAWVRWSGIACLAIGTLVMAALGPALDMELIDNVTPGAWAVTLAIGGLGLACVTLAARVRDEASATRLAIGLGVSAALASLLLKGSLVPGQQALQVTARTSAALVEAGVHPRLSPGQPGPLIGAGYQEPSLIFLTRTDSALSSVPAAVAAARLGSGVAVEAANAGALSAGLAERGLAVRWIGAEIDGLNYSKGDPVRIRIGQVVTVR